MVRIKQVELLNVFAVELWNRGETRVLEVLATSANFHIARAAFVEAIRLHPGRPVLVRHGIRVVLRSHGDDPAFDEKTT